MTARSRPRRRAPSWRGASAFAAAALLSLLGATWRFPDSAHAMGLVSRDGGRVSHPVHLPAGRRRYTMIVTARVLPPYRGDAVLRVEGARLRRVAVQPVRPVLDLRPGRRPRIAAGRVLDLRPGDRLAFWVVLEFAAAAEPGTCTIRLAEPVSGQPLLTLPLRLVPDEESTHGRR